MRESIDMMRLRHEKEVKELQNTCKHKFLSGWVPYMWAPGHFGNNIRFCTFCGKIVETEKVPVDIHHDGG